MWQRIKQAILQHPTFAPLPLFAKMVLLYSSIVFFILIVVSVITVASIHYIMNDSIKEDLESSAQNRPVLRIKPPLGKVKANGSGDWMRCICKWDVISCQEMRLCRVM